jgi:protein ImuB
MAAGGAVTTPRSVHHGQGTRAKVLFCDARARHVGVHPGQPLATARSRASLLSSAGFDARRLADGQRDAVGELVVVSPRITVAGADRFWVEPVSFGEGRSTNWNARAFETWTRDVTHLLGRYGPVAVGIGPTAAVAWAAACSVGPGCTGHRFVPPEQARAFLDDAPLEALEIDGGTLDILASLGIRRIRELRALDPVSLGMRFGSQVADARRRAEGFDLRGPLTHTPRAPTEVRIDLDDEVSGVEPLLFLLRPAAERLATELRRRDEGTVHLRLALGSREVSVRTGTPLADGPTFVELLRTRLERERLDTPVTSLCLSAEDTVPRRRTTEPLFRHGTQRDPGAREVALDRLRGRLGETSLRRAGRVEDGSVLERARWLFARELGVAPGGEAMPWRRLDPPAPVAHGRAHVAGRWRQVRKVGRVERTDGPWWEGDGQRVSLVAWAELDGPLLVLMHARCGTDCRDHWEVLAWVD